MVITDNTNTQVTPVLSLQAHLVAELNAFAVPGNVAGAALLTPLLANPNVVVTIQNTGTTATKGTRVTANLTQTHAPPFEEFVESVIFELTNASNSAAFATLEDNLKNGLVSVRDYGRRKADLEASASWNLAQILLGRGGYARSAFGQGHVNACQQHANLAAFQAFFRGQPHDPNAAINTVMRLPSEEMYAYNGAVTVAATNSTLNLCLPINDMRKLPPKGIKAANLKSATGPANVSTISTQQPLKAARFYWTLVEALRNPPAGVAVTWRHGTIANWEFTAGMQAVSPDNPDPWQPKITQWLNNKNTKMY